MSMYILPEEGGCMIDDAKIERYRILLVRHRAMVQFLCLQRTWNDPNRACDLVQDVALAIWRSMDSLDIDATVAQERRWVWSVTRTVVHNHSRRRQREISLESIPDVAAADDDIARARETVGELIEMLSAEDRELMRQYLDGYKKTEIAAMRGITPQAVGQHMKRIEREMEKIYKILNKDK